ncbi:Dipeptidyl aminopeptidase/acylaminoacyl peptidase [Lysobacter spongiicola DSM 21749]|uniref:Dipeptidyl aminopeptidase/acylaminoacyl peptidase n=2 Tax=Novilysobacter TaxID=3382699 RepID=A0A1T4MA27_9GAMM|nr:Dipeptidyl aminopeptidase/acylaminoacyl peptidase [Lysobacter spongiicola DSM 21749]
MVRSIVLLAGLATAIAVAEAREIPVGDFFKDPEFTSVSLSPKGDYIAVSVPQGDRTVLAAFRIEDMELVGKWDYGSNLHIDRVRWVNDERFFMYVTEKTGRFDQRQGRADVYASNVDGSQRADIPNGGTYQIVDILPEDPSNILVSRSIESAFLSKMRVRDGSVRTVATAPIDYGTFLVDHDGNVRYAFGQEESNDTVTLRRDGETWTQVHSAPMGGPKRQPLAMASDNKHAWVEVSKNGEPAQLMLVDPETGSEKVVSGNPNVEASNLLFSSDERELLAVAYEDGTPRYDFTNTEHDESKVYAGLINAFPDHAVSFRGISDNGRYILVTAYSDIDPGSYYLYDRETGSAKFLLAAMGWIKPSEMSPMEPFTFTARDGTKVHGYLTIPRFSNGKNLPLILHPHGGPHGPRDSWRFNPEVQFLANRGYAVLQVNFRGSGGYGNAFEAKGYRNWGTTMVDDMTDAVNWAVARGVADKDRLCTYGASYGGYAALQTVVREPTKYQCAIGYVGVYSLPLMFKDGDIPEQDSGRNYLQRVMPETLAEQQAQSPAFNVDRINIPVMLVQGAKDRRVPMSQYEALRDALANAGKPAEITIVADKEGHGFYDYDNQVDLYTKMEGFLDKHMGMAQDAR